MIMFSLSGKAQTAAVKRDAEIGVAQVSKPNFTYLALFNGTAHFFRFD
jgi:hypothetical protein